MTYDKFAAGREIARLIIDKIENGIPYQQITVTAEPVFRESHGGIR